jgi:hypothetical protein
MFDVKHHSAVIIVEDDLDIAPVRACMLADRDRRHICVQDFFEYMTMGQSLLAADPTLWCVSGTATNTWPPSVAML